MAAPATRYDIRLNVRLTLAGSESRFAGVSQNLSETGVLVLAERVEPRGVLLDLEFPLFKSTGEVIWTQDSEDEPGAFIGMKFISLSRKDRKALLQFLKSPTIELAG